MSIRTYYRWALLLPILVPLPAILVVMLVPDFAGLVSYFLWGSLMVGGVPYVLFAAGLLVWSRGRTDAEMRRAILRSPLVFTWVLMVCAIIFLAVDSELGNVDFLAAVGGFGLAFGYGYVALAELGRLILRPHPAAPVTSPAL